MNECYAILQESFPDVDIKLQGTPQRFIIDGKNLSYHFASLKKVIKVLIFELQSKVIEKNTIVININDKDFFDDNIIRILNIMKLTKTLHRFEIIITQNYGGPKGLDERIDLIKGKYVGININKE